MGLHVQGGALEGKSAYEVLNSARMSPDVEKAMEFA